MTAQLSVIEVLNSFLADQEFPPCSDFSLSSLGFSLTEDSEQVKIYELFPQIGATCEVQIIPLLPPTEISVVFGAKLPLVFESDDFSTDVPVSLKLGDSFGCDSLILENTNGGDVSVLLDLFCDDIDIPQLVIDGFAQAEPEVLFAELREFTGGPFVVQSLSDTLLAEEAAFNVNGFEILTEDGALQVVESIASQTLEIPFVEELLGSEVIQQIKAFIESGFDIETFFPVGDYGYEYRQLQAYNYNYNGSVYENYYEGGLLFSIFSSFLFLINPDLFLGEEIFDIESFANSTISEALAILEVDNEELEQSLEDVFGSDITILELTLSEETLETLAALELLSIIPLFVDDQVLLDELTPFLTGVTLGNLFEFPNLSLDELLTEIELDEGTQALIASFLDIQSSLVDVISALFAGDILELINIDLATFLPPELLPVLDLVFGAEVPSDPFEIVEEVLDFVVERIQNLTLDFSEPFTQESAEILQLIALFDSLVAENIEDIVNGNITVGDFAALAELPVIEIPLSALQSLTVSPAFIGLDAIIAVEQTTVPGSSSLILPSVVVGEGSTITIVLAAELNGETTEFTFEAELGFSLDVAVGVIANLEGLLDVGLFNIEQPEDAAEFGTAIGVCAASQVGFSIISAAPAFTLTNVKAEFSAEADEGLNELFEGFLNDLYINFVPNLANNALNSLFETLTFTSIVEGDAECEQNSIANNAAADDGDDENENALLIPVIAGVAGLFVLIVLIVLFTKGNNIQKTNSQKKKDILEGEEQAAKAAL